MHKQSFPVINGVLICRSAGALPPLSIAHYCTRIAQKHSHKQCGLFAVQSLSVSLLACLVTPPPPPPCLSLHSHHLAGHAYFHAHRRPSSNVQGAVIYGARSLSVYAGNSNTQGRTAGHTVFQSASAISKIFNSRLYAAKAHIETEIVWFHESRAATNNSFHYQFIVFMINCLVYRMSKIVKLFSSQFPRAQSDVLLSSFRPTSGPKAKDSSFIYNYIWQIVTFKEL